MSDKSTLDESVLTLDDAIKHAEDVAQSCMGNCSLNHRQLVFWLKDYRRLLQEMEIRYD